MDSLSQLILGAAVAELALGKKLGNKAILLGMAAGTLPDLDVVIYPLIDTVTSLDQHRGFTHSISFWLLGSAVFAWLSKKIAKKASISIKNWFWMYFWVFSTHALLDCFTSWGTQLFWPFSKLRVAFRSIFIIDPLYTIPLLLCVIPLFFFKKDNKTRRAINIIGLCISSLYLLFTLGVKTHINTVFAQSFQKQDLAVTRFETRPTAFNTLLWTIIAEKEDSYLIGYYSLLDKDKNIRYISHQKNHNTLTPYVKNKKLQTLLRIMNGYYNIEENSDEIFINDLRFGQLFDWETQTGPFVFTYYFRPEKQNDISFTIKQKQRDFDDTNRLLKQLFKRIQNKY